MTMMFRVLNFLVVNWICTLMGFSTGQVTSTDNPVDIQCPNQCTCNVNGKINIQLECEITADGFNMESAVYNVVALLPNDTAASVNISLEIHCKEKRDIIWNSVAYFGNVLLLHITNCSVYTSGNVLIFQKTSKLQDLLFKEINANVFDRIDLRNLRHVKSLTIEKCDLTKVPMSIIPTDTSQLGTLSFQSNAIRDIDCDVLNAYRCQADKCSVNFNFNHIRRIPKCACDTQTIFYSLQVVRNTLTDIQSFGCLKQTHIDLPYNDVEDLPTFKYSGAITFAATFNKIKFIKRETFTNLEICQTINLSYNEIQLIEAGAFNNLRNLNYLRLTSNKLKQFEVVHAPTASIYPCNIHLEKNELEYPPYNDNNYAPPQLFRTYAKDNPFVCDCTAKVFQDRMNENRHLETSLPGRTLFGTTYTILSQVFIGADQFKCSIPKYVSGHRMLKLNMSYQCPVAKKCPIKCVCTKILSTEETLVNCSSRALTQLPENMPNKSPIAIDLSNNSITLLGKRDYFIRASSLNISRNQIHLISPDVVPLLWNLSFLDVRHNRLLSLPRTFEDTKFRNSTSLFFSVNNWTCTCDNVWMSGWLNSHSYLVADDDDIDCADESAEQKYNIRELNADKLLCNPTKSSQAILAISLGFIACVLVVSSILIFYFLDEIRVLFYTRIQIRLSIQEQPEKQFDAFISYSEHDRKFTREIVDKLENGLALPYKICIHDRDFMIGSPIAENISSAINNSRFVMFIVSNHFLESNWCTFEFQTSYQTMLLHHNIKLIVIKHGDLDEKKLDQDLRAFFRTKSFIKSDEPLFWDKLLYYLPRRDD